MYKVRTCTNKFSKMEAHSPSKRTLLPGMIFPLRYFKACSAKLLFLLLLMPRGALVPTSLYSCTSGVALQPVIDIQTDLPG